MNWWMLASGLSALLCTAGHAAAGVRTFYRPIKAVIIDQLQAGVFTGMWHLITINFALSAIALIVLGIYAPTRAVAWLVASQFAGYAAVYGHIAAPRRSVAPISMDAFRFHRNIGGYRRTNGALTRLASERAKLAWGSMAGWQCFSRPAEIAIDSIPPATSSRSVTFRWQHYDSFWSSNP